MGDDGDTMGQGIALQGLFSATIFVKLAAKDLRHKHILKCVPVPKNWMVKRPEATLPYIYICHIYNTTTRWSKGCDIKV